jgi:hypothetical protein
LLNICFQDKEISDKLLSDRHLKIGDMELITTKYVPPVASGELENKKENKKTEGIISQKNQTPKSIIISDDDPDSQESSINELADSQNSEGEIIKELCRIDRIKESTKKLHPGLEPSSNVFGRKSKSKKQKISKTKIKRECTLQLLEVNKLIYSIKKESLAKGLDFE